METDNSTAYSCSIAVADGIANGELVLSDAMDSNTKNRVWTVYSKISDLNGSLVNGYVCCKICKKIFKFNASTTSNLVKHRCYILKYVHKPESPVSIIEAEMPKLENSNVSFDYNVDNPDNQLMKLITKWLIRNCRSYELIHNDEFKAILKIIIEIGAKYGTNIDIDNLLPTPQAVVTNINDIYGNCFKRVQGEIAAFKENGFGLALHVGTNNFLNKSYIALTIHFLKGGDIKCRFLGLRPLDGDKWTSQTISTKIEHILNDYGCKLSTKSILVASGCNDLTNAHTLPCISDLLSNALQKSIDDVPEVAELINSCIKLQNFLNRQLINIFPQQSFCPSRWITLYKILESMATHWIQIEESIQLKKYVSQIENISIDHLKAVIATLEPFEEAFCGLEKEDKSTLHLVIIYLHQLRKSCDTRENEFEEYDFIANLKGHLRLHLEKIATENVTVLHKLALFLYPPTKKLLQYNDQEKESIEAECIRLMKYFEDDLNRNIKKEKSSSSTAEFKRLKLFSDFVYSEINNDQNEFIMQELQIYKMTRVVYREDFDVYSWWELQKDNLPILYKLSRMILAVPASSISAQQIFISTGSLLCDKLSGLDSSATDIEHFAFINLNAEQDEPYFVT